MLHRKFVLQPVSDLDAHIKIPGKRGLYYYLKNTSNQETKKVTQKKFVCLLILYVLLLGNRHSPFPPKAKSPTNLFGVIFAKFAKEPLNDSITGFNNPQ